ncbi:hypothetical protein ACFVWX_21110 [Streptomyces sp. NPDC058220]|uniref:hypothetical protein n=2 Tax=Streptomyces TaxID=1883 RepID=UPI0036E0B6F8
MSDEDALRRVNPAMASVLYDPESMVAFKKRVDQLIINLNGSAAGPDKVGAEPVGRGQFGGGGPGWIEAAGLSDAYTTVIDQLKQLSKLLADSLEGMGIAVVASKDGFGQLDDDIGRRMRAIQESAKEHYDPRRDPTVPDQHQDTTQQGQPDDTSGGQIQ